METIVSAVIGAVVAIATCLINNNMQRAKEQHAMEMKMQEIKASNEQSSALIRQQIETLTEHVNKHNNLVERMYNVEALTVRLQDMVNDIKEDDRK